LTVIVVVVVGVVVVGVVIVGVVIVMGIPLRMALALGRCLGRSTVGGDAAKHPDSAIAEGLKTWPGGGAHDHRHGDQAQRREGEEASEERGNG
jgi:hypothetical protein